MSRTTQPAGAPYEWHDYVASDRARVAENELDACLQNTCVNQADYDLCVEGVDARKRRAAAGRLAPSSEVTPVMSQPVLWEIKWDFSDRQLRLYHAEPQQDPRALLALMYHWKDTSGRTPSEVNTAQNAQMAEAAERYRRSPLHPVDGLDC
ncbi:hypothetical protein [Cellulomonas sp. KRMCY2]|uniref:hypothetical protein n=1 Tax=Cellulomonas sp. KRMCY2 TaxID=1304865 RepID=UPI00045E8061|nr:hypothetical protein [Cellulomonas sp. KRMCY2]